MRNCQGRQINQSFFLPYRTLLRALGATLLVVTSGCTGISFQPSEAEFPRFSNDEATSQPRVEPLTLSPSERMSFPQVRLTSQTDVDESRFSFLISNMEAKEGLRQFAKAYGLNIAIDSDVSGVLDVEFQDVPLDEALSLMLDSLDYYWEIGDGGAIRVKSVQTRQFNVDYLRLVRKGTGSSSATVSSASAETEGGGGESGEEAGSISISHDDEIHFWLELESQIEQLLSDSGSLVMNRLSGTIQVTDQHVHVERIAAFLDHMHRAIHRQVDIEVKILEVMLDDTTALGVNWSRVSQVLDSGTNLDFSIAGSVDTPAGGLTPLRNVLTLDAFNLKNDGNRRIAAVIDALEQQGEVQIVSQPRVRTLNNQTSMIKVGTDRTFFRREQSTDSTSAGSLTTATDIPQVVTEGVVLSITPQIGERGWVMMDVSPVVTRVSSISTVEGPSGQVQSSAPNLDVAQVSSLIRARSGETVVIGGLIQTQESRTDRHLPGMGRIGLLGKLAGGGRYESVVRKELVMVLTPTVVQQEG